MRLSFDVAIDVVTRHDVLRRGSCTASDTNAHTVLEKAICQEVIDHRPRFVRDDYGIAAQQLCRALLSAKIHAGRKVLQKDNVVNPEVEATRSIGTGQCNYNVGDTLQGEGT